MKWLRLLGVILAGQMVLSLGGCALSPIPHHIGGPGCYSSNGKEDLVKGASLIAAATGGKAGSVATYECEDGAWGAIVISYDDGLTISDLIAQVAALPYCSLNTTTERPLGTPTYGDYFCVPVSTRLRVTPSSDEVSLVVHLAP